MEDLAGKVAVVTGAASGIGLATARALAGEGMTLVLADIEEAALHSARDDLADDGHDVLAVVTDVSSGEAMDALADSAWAAYGTVDLIHLNAGVAAAGAIWTVSQRDWDWVLGVNLWGVIHGVRAFVPRMIEQKTEGHVVVTASIAGLVSSMMLGPYNVSKHGVVALAETLQRDLDRARAPIGVSVLCPGWVRTRIGESGRNRPEGFAADPAAATPAADTAASLARVLQNGMDPAEVAAQVVDAVKAKRFYVRTHPDWDSLIDDRFTDIRENRTPRPMFLPT